MCSVALLSTKIIAELVDEIVAKLVSGMGDKEDQLRDICSIGVLAGKL